ncbi:MAG: hypothetical protein WA742_06710 [Candidatus Cybelea sp.]|jgi:hypothetical protein
MSKRLQVILDDREYRDVQRAAKVRRLSVAQWVRDALQAARRREPAGDLERKLHVIREAAKFEFPTADIDRMLAEIERGYETERRA